MSASPPPDVDQLDDDELIRYSRQIVLTQVGGAGQLRLRDAAIAVVGAGGLGSPALLQLAASGIGRLTIIDDDSVSLDNLGRQVLYRTADIGLAKAEVAAQRVRELNPHVRAVAVAERLDGVNASRLLAGHDLVIEASDNFATKFAVNDACVALRIPAVIGAALRFEGQVVTVPAGAPCYRCLFQSEPPDGLFPTCSSAGILGAVTGIVGALQVTEVLRLLLGTGEPQGGTVITVDALRPRVRSVAFPRDPSCTACAQVAQPAADAR